MSIMIRGLNFSDNLMEQDINIGENFIQNINIQEI